MDVQLIAEVLQKGVKLLMFLHTVQLEAKPEQEAQIGEHKLHDPLFEKYPFGQLLTHCDPINKNPAGQVKQLIPVLAS